MLSQKYSKQQKQRCIPSITPFPSDTPQGIPAIVTFVTAGYPTIDDTIPILLGMQAGGADIIELGVPFSDPIADGPVIQESNTVCLLSNELQKSKSDRVLSQVALKQDVDYVSVLRILKESRNQGLKVPVMLMGNNTSLGSAQTQPTCPRLLQPYPRLWRGQGNTRRSGGRRQWFHYG